MPMAFSGPCRRWGEGPCLPPAENGGGGNRAAKEAGKRAEASKKQAAGPAGSGPERFLRKTEGGGGRKWEGWIGLIVKKTTT